MCQNISRINNILIERQFAGFLWRVCEKGKSSQTLFHISHISKRNTESQLEKTSSQCGDQPPIVFPDLACQLTVLSSLK
jgi:hypothetical protein